jgi:hypothetical protein
MRLVRWTLPLAIFVSVIATSCGGGGGNTTPPPPPPPKSVTITSFVLPFGIAGKTYAGAQLQATGGTAPYSWTSPNPVTGLAVSSDGKVSGTINVDPTPAAVMEVDVQDAAGLKAKANVSIKVVSPIAIYVYGNNYMTSGSRFVGAIFAIPGDQSLHTTIKIVSGSLPPGLSLVNPSTWTNSAQSVEVSGTPTQSGVFTFTAEATSNSNPPETEQALLSLYVDVAPINWYDQADLPFAKRANSYQFQFFYIQGGTKPYNFVLAPGSTPLPPGMSLAADGTISGIPSAIGSYPFTVRLTDSSATYPQTIDQNFRIKVVEPVVVNGTLPDGITGEIYTSPSLTISGGTPPYEFNGTFVSSCCFTFEQHDMSLHGVPYFAGQQNLQIGIRDSAGQFISQNLTFNVAAGPFRSTPDMLPDAGVGRLLSGYLNSISGKAPITWRLASGTTPPGVSLNFNPNPSFYGYPTTPGTYQFTIEAQDSSATPQILSFPQTIHVFSSIPRNDGITTATTWVTAGGQQASISPYADPPDIPNPDQDYYHVRAFAGQTVSIDVQANTQVMDPVVEIVDINGHRFSTCRNPEDDDPALGSKADPTPYAFDDSCVNDDVVTGVDINSQLLFRVPGSSGTLVDFYFHIVDFRGDARPDMTYYYSIGFPAAVK